MRPIKSLLTPSKTPHKSYRDELISKLTSHLNRERKGRFGALSKATVAKLVNLCPMLAGKKNDGELSALITRCLEDGTFRYANYILFPKKKV